RSQDGLDRPQDGEIDAAAGTVAGDARARASERGRRMNKPLWSPSAERIAKANLTAFAARAAAKHGVKLPDYTALWRWSVEDRAAFWSEFWEYCGVVGEPGARTLVDGDKMPGARWFPDARLNYAENLLARNTANDRSDAFVFWGEDKQKRRMSYGELRAEGLQAAGVKQGDRVAAFIPNMPEAIVAMLASSSMGAVFSSASPDFGVQGVVDRFGQIEPTVLFTVDGYWYNGKAQPIVEKVAEI